MSFEEALHSTQSLLDIGHLTGDENSMPSEFWQKNVAEYIESFLRFIDMLTNNIISLCPPPAQLIILVGGVLGNLLTSKILHSNAQLETITVTLLNALKKGCNVSTTRQLLLLSPRDSSQPVCDSLCTQVLRLCVVQIAHASPSTDSVDPLNTRPIYRDALFWLCVELDYPEIANDEFVGILQPLGLRLTNDYRAYLQLAGFRILQELATKARVIDWRQNNRAEAVVHQLFERQIGSSPSFSEHVLRELYATLFALVSLLSPTDQDEWNIKLTNRILFDLTMETRNANKCVLLHCLSSAIDNMKGLFAAHTRQFLRVVSIVLLGPRCPDHLRGSLPKYDQDEAVCMLTLECVKKFIHFCWPLVSPTLLPGLLPPLIAFVDLETARADNKLDCSTNLFNELKLIIDHLVDLGPSICTDILQSACSFVPSLTSVVSVQPPHSCN